MVSYLNVMRATPMRGIGLRNLCRGRGTLSRRVEQGIMAKKRVPMVAKTVEEKWPKLAKATRVSIERRAQRRLAAPPAGATTAKRSPGRPPGCGLQSVKKKIAVHGIGIVARNTLGGKLLFAWRNALVDALGGESNVSPQQLQLIDCCCREKLFLDHCDAWLMEQPSLTQGKRKGVLPVLLDRMKIATALKQSLSMLGLQRQAKQLETLQEYSERRRREIDEAHAHGEKDVDEIDDDDDEAEAVQRSTIEPVEPEPAA